MASLLIGNGINYLAEDVVGWEDLLETLIDRIDKRAVINTKEKPFLHLYEEIFTRAEKYTDKKEKEIKKFIVDEIRRMQPNPYHQRIMSLPFEHILTLNYDYSFTENSDVKNREGKYSLKRHQSINGKKVWHIHGELDNQNSIMLGYSHYMDSINNIQSYLNSSKKNEVNNSTWVDIFLTDDIYILGAGLDFEELDIWWLLSYKNRERLERKTDLNNPAYDTKIVYIDITEKEHHNNKIVQEVKNHNQELSKVKKLVTAEIKKQQKEAKLSMLKTFDVGIETFILDDSDDRTANYRKAYDDIIDYFSNKLSKDSK